jgi:hypothetical protein
VVWCGAVLCVRDACLPLLLLLLLLCLLNQCSTITFDVLDRILTAVVAEQLVSNRQHDYQHAMPGTCCKANLT